MESPDLEGLIKRRRIAVEQRLTFRARRKFASREIPQTCAELPFELIDASAQRISRHAQTPRRIGKAAGTDDLDEPSRDHSDRA
jgi:hypothetical protein